MNTILQVFKTLILIAVAGAVLNYIQQSLYLTRYK